MINSINKLIINNSLIVSIQSVDIDSRNKPFTLDSEPKCRNKANMRKFKAETRLKVDSNQELVDALMKYGNNPENLSPLNCAIEKEDYKAALLFVRHFQPHQIDIKDNNKYPVDRLLYILCKKHSISVDQDALIRGLIEGHYRSVSSGGATLAFSIHVGLYGNDLLVEWVFPKTLQSPSSLLYGVANSGRKNLLQKLLLKLEDPKKHISPFLLSYAARSGSLEMVRFVWEELGLRPDPGEKYSMYLGNAMWSKSVGVLEYLLEKGLSPNSPEKMLPKAFLLPDTTEIERRHKNSVIDAFLRYGAIL